MSNPYRPLNIASRALFVLWMLDEAYAFQKRNDPAHTDVAAESPPMWALVLLLVPVIWPLPLPRPLRISGLILQLLGLLLIVGARRQLIAANSFGWSSEAATQPQQQGFYQALEHPIYDSMLIQVLGLTAANPLIMLLPMLATGYIARIIVNERRYLEQLGTVHRGIDSAYWDFAITLAER